MQTKKRRHACCLGTPFKSISKATIVYFAKLGQTTQRDYSMAEEAAATGRTHALNTRAASQPHAARASVARARLTRALTDALASDGQ
eukprot:2969810-Pleurochrysis_carterae.AAC.1